jgi:hypothetical protein
MSSSKLAFLGFLAIVGSASSAFAAEIDFTASNFAAANGQTSFSYTATDGVTLTLTAAPARLTYDATDGLGVRTGSTDLQPNEIDNNEVLTITFSESVRLSDVFITDLFNEGYLETGYYSLNNGPAIAFTALPTQGFNTNGSLSLHLDTWVTSLTLTSPPNYLGGLIGPNHDYSVGGLAYTTAAAAAPPAPTPAQSVPELGGNAAPMALSLLVGCAVLISNRRRTRA